MNKLAAVVGALFCLIGMAALFVGLAMPAFSGSLSEEETQQASEYLSASAAMEAAASIRDPAKRREAIAQAKDRYQTSRATVEATQAAQRSRQFWLKVGGGVATALGVVVLLTSRPSKS